MSVAPFMVSFWWDTLVAAMVHRVGCCNQSSLSAAPASDLARLRVYMDLLLLRLWSFRSGSLEGIRGPAAAEARRVPIWLALMVYMDLLLLRL